MLRLPLRHRLFTTVLIVAATLRGIVMLGYPPALWFEDSFEYVGMALRMQPYRIRPDGYPFLLWLLQPFHSFALVAALQHLMGLAMGVMIYALLRRRLPGGERSRQRSTAAWGATLATVPVLLDGNVITLEHTILSDTLFTFLVTTAVVALLWRRDTTVPIVIAIGLLIAGATLTRSAGLPLPAILLGYLLLRRAGRREVCAAAIACVLPLVAYATWFNAHHGSYALTSGSGVWLWSRTTPFADCGVIRPPADEAVLCPRQPRGQRPASSVYLWAPWSPLTRVEGRAFAHRSDRFANEIDERAGNFGRRAILAQPLDYLTIVAIDLGRTFGWGIKSHQEPVVYNLYALPTKEGTLPNRVEIPGGDFHGDLRSYERAGSDPATTQITEPFAGFMRIYQRFFWLPGFVLGGALLVGLAGVVRGRRHWAPGLLAWSVATVLLVMPALTAGSSPRYRLAGIPLAYLAAAIAIATWRRRTLTGGEADSPNR